jgi:O-antigen/teichoic acid export membrane protein
VSRLTLEMGKRWRDSLFRNSLYLMASSAITAVVGFVFWMLAARIYPAEDVGIASAVISAMMLIALLATLGLDYGIVRFLPGAGRDTDGMINTCLTLTGLAAIVISTVFVLGVGVWSPPLAFLRHNWILFLAFVGFCTVGTVSMLIGRAFVAERKAAYTLLQGTVFNVSRLALVAGLSASFAAFGVYGSWGLGHAMALSVAALVLLPHLRKGYRPLPLIRAAVISKLVRFSFANYVTALLWMAPTFILPLMVVSRLGAEANAYFYIAWAIANVLFAVPLATSVTLLAEGAHDDAMLASDAKRTIALTLSVIIPLVILLAVAGDKVLSVFNPAYAENAFDLLRLLSISAVPLSVNFVYFGVLRVRMRMWPVVLLSGFIAFSTLVAGWFLLPRMDILGPGVAWFSSQGLAAVLVTLWTLRSIRGKSARA